MNKAYLLTGGNKGDRHSNLSRASELIKQQCGHIITHSSLYETAAWGKTNQPAFLNQALLVETALDPAQLMHTLLDIEQQMGRVRQEKYGSRIIDIDILLFNHAILDTSLVRVPHPELQNRRFALVPLNEIAAQYEHPVLRQTIRSLLDNCKDLLPVNKIDD